MTIEEQITTELDGILAQRIEARRAEREARATHAAASARLREVDQRACNLRLALYRLNGETGEAGDANADNNRRENAIVRGEVQVQADGGDE